MKRVRASLDSDHRSRKLVVMRTAHPPRALLACVAGLSCAWALAHHSFAATYLLDRQITIEGQVVQLLFRNPHSFVHVLVVDPAGKEQRWAVEWSGAAGLAHDNVSHASLQPGDHVIIEGSPGRNPEDHRLLMHSVRRPSDGWSWSGTFQ